MTADRSLHYLSIPLEIQLDHSDITSENHDEQLYGDKDGSSASGDDDSSVSGDDDSDSSDATQDEFGNNCNRNESSFGEKQLIQFKTGKCNLKTNNIINNTTIISLLFGVIIMDFSFIKIRSNLGKITSHQETIITNVFPRFHK